jgi:hypothetical protein
MGRKKKAAKKTAKKKVYHRVAAPPPEPETEPQSEIEPETEAPPIPALPPPPPSELRDEALRELQREPGPPVVPHTAMKIASTEPGWPADAPNPDDVAVAYKNDWGDWVFKMKGTNRKIIISES